MANRSEPPPLPDQAQRRLIETDLDSTMLVEAAAGTGKTTSMVRRMVALLREGRCRVATMAAVTFTRKAAAELRARFQLALESSAREEPAGPGRERLSAALRNVEQCFVGTIHSFCGRLLRERPVEAGVDVGFEELDENAEFRLRNEAWAEYLARLHAGHSQVLGQLDELGLELVSLKPAYLDFAQYPDVEEWPAAPVALDAAAVERAWAELRAYARHMQSLAPALPRHGGNDKLIPIYHELPRRLDHLTKGRPGEFVDLLEDFAAEARVVQRNWPGGAAQAIQEQARWSGFVHAHALPLVERRRLERYAPVLSLLREAVAVYDALRSERGALNYQDLLMKAADLLRGNPHVRRYFRRRFTHLLVDEFQDTDPIQAQVMLLLTADDPAQRDWRSCRPAPGSLFVVGDPKQSIYRFRRADIVTYNQVREIIGRCGRVTHLTANFRSTPGIIEWVNGVSQTLFPQDADDYSPADRPMQAARGARDLADHRGALSIDLPDGNRGAALEFEAQAIAATVRSAIAGGHAKPSDFMVVTWTRDALGIFALRLQEQGVPVEVTGGAAVNDVDEVALLRSALAVIADPDDQVALVGALRSALFGISDTALYRYAEAGGRFCIHQAERAAAIPGAAAIAEALERLRRYADWLVRMQPVAAIERIAVDLGLFARAASGPDGADRAGGLAKAIELLRSAGGRYWTPADLVGYLDEIVLRETAFPERHDGMPVRPHAEAVRVMNLHQVKGLEAPVVFLAESPSTWRDDVSLCVERREDHTRGYLALRLPRRNFREGRILALPEEWPAREAEERRFREAERDRLLYVAATRAASQLVICRSARGESRWLKLASAIRPENVLPVPAPAPPRGGGGAALDPDAPMAFALSVADRWKRLGRRSHDVLAAKAAALRGGAHAPAHARDAQDISGEHGTEWGSVMHTVLEAAMARPGQDLAAVAAAALDENGLDQGLGASVLAAAERVMASDLWRRAQAASKRLTEVPIQYLQPGGSGEGGVPTLVRGVIDLVFREAGGWVIVDYKTDDRDESGLAELAGYYAPQVRAYASAWSLLTGEPVAEAVLFFVGTRRAVRIELTEEAPASA